MENGSQKNRKYHIYFSLSIHVEWFENEKGRCRGEKEKKKENGKQRNGNITHTHTHSHTHSPNVLQFIHVDLFFLKSYTQLDTVALLACLSFAKKFFFLLSHLPFPSKEK